ncbi:MAG: DUF2066 domain-containing protein [Parahaliea sp.]
MLLLALSPAQAEVVTDLYQGQVAVPDRSQSALLQAASQALSQVLVKASGSNEVLALPAIGAVLPDAVSQAQQFSYVRTGDPLAPLAARFEFDQGWVSDLLAQAGAPQWTANRPSVLVWLVQDGPEGRQFVTRDSAPELIAELEAGFARRGVPVRFPMFDLTDAQALTVDQAWAMSTPSLQQASARYRTQEILAGRLSEQADGRWFGDWAYLSAKNRLDRRIKPVALADFLHSGLALAVDDMAVRYAVRAGSMVDDGIHVSVSNVRTYADYAAVITWLEGLELVRHAQVYAVRGDLLQLQLQARANAEQLKPLIELNRQLVPATRSGTADELTYQWHN